MQINLKIFCSISYSMDRNFRSWGINLEESIYTVVKRTIIVPQTITRNNLTHQKNNGINSELEYFKETSEYAMRF